MKPLPPNSNVYFPNLNGLRAIGAFIVLFSHFYFVKTIWGFPATQWFPVPGKLGVALFFALSGFLITSLLFREKKKTHTIRLRHFYIRRILRIWPLYYGILLIGLFVINRVPSLKMPVLSDRMYHDMNWLNLLSLMLIVPNFTHFYIPYTDQRWSIIIEEQFYLVQPALLRWFRKRYTLISFFCGIAFSSELFILAVRVVHADRYLSAGIIGSIAEQLKYLGCIAIGCIFSALYYDRGDASLKVCFSKVTQAGVLVALVAMICISYFVRHDESYFDLRLYSFLFGIVVVNAALNPRNIFRLENPVLNLLGKISYGIYMYHMFCLGIGFYLARTLTSNPLVQDVLFYPLSIGLTVLVSWVSYRTIEAFFLGLQPGKRKKRPASAAAQNISSVLEK